MDDARAQKKKAKANFYVAVAKGLVLPILRRGQSRNLQRQRLFIVYSKLGSIVSARGNADRAISAHSHGLTHPIPRDIGIQQ